MKKFIVILTLKKDQRGASLIVVAIALFFLIGFAALAVDFGYSHVVRNQIQNAADAGALAGANDLFNADGSINTGANQTGYNTATSNKSGGNAVEVNWTSPENDTDVQRGHWTFGNPGVFTENSNTTQINLFIPNHDYNADTDFINAVKVVTHNTQIPSFFAKIFGYGNYQRTSDAVAIRTGAGYFEHGDFDFPIAICWEAIVGPNGFECNIGRMLNSGSNADTHNTGGWTNFTQPCVTANPSNIPTGCGAGNTNAGPDRLYVNQGMGTVGGVQQSVLEDIRDCFFDPATENQLVDDNGDPILDANGDPMTVSRDLDGNGEVDTPLYAVLPVILCPGNNISNCATLFTSVQVQIVWVSEGGTG
ncbi:MAG: pilus assembly protein TadG-related protein, partial [Desulfobacterales bacterium]